MPRLKGHRGALDQVASPQRDAVEAEPVGDRVHQALAHEGAFVAPGRAIGAGRRLVGQPDMAGRAIGGNLVGPGQHAGGQVGDRRGVGADIGALVDPELVVEPEHEAGRVDRGADAMELVARMVGGQQMLLAVLDPFDRPLQRSAARQTSTSSG